jgi:hypothetical protein
MTAHKKAVQRMGKKSKVSRTGYKGLKGSRGTRALLTFLEYVALTFSWHLLTAPPTMHLLVIISG